MDPALARILGDDVPPHRIHDALDRRYCALLHLTRGRPLFGVLRAGGDDALAWLAGGADMADRLGPAGRPRREPAGLDALFAALGISPEAAARTRERLLESAPGEAHADGLRLPADDGRVYALIYHHRAADGCRQFTLGDISGFVAAEQATRRMAAELLDGLAAGDPDGLTLVDRLERLEDGVRDLLRRDDPAAAADALAASVDGLAETATALLRRFEDRPASPQTAVGEIVAAVDWPAIAARIRALAEETERPTPEETEDLVQAWTFAVHALPILIFAGGDGRIRPLNGPAAAETFESVPALLRGLGVEANSRRTAQGFFETLPEAPATASFALQSQNIEARGHPVAGGCWQAMLAPAATGATDLRSLFHGLKNLLLQLQVLHVLRTPEDVADTADALADTLAALRDRLETLRHLAAEGRLPAEAWSETVDDWTAAAERVALGRPGRVGVDLAPELDGLEIPTAPGEMADALSELTTNALAAGAGRVHIEGRLTEGYVVLRVVDDGPGMTDARLSQARRMLAEDRPDPGLSTREGGTGNGLLGVARSLRRLVDGTLHLDRGPDGRGLEAVLTFKIPATGPETPSWP